MRASSWLVAACLVFGLACGDDGGEEEMGRGDGGHEHEGPEVDCDQDIPTFDEVAAFDKCTECHSSDLTGSERMGAPAGFNWDEEDTADEHAEHIAHVVFEGMMPPEDSDITLTAAEKEDLYLWALCR